MNLNKKISSNFTRRYIFALSLVAILSIAGQVLVQIALFEQSTDSRVVNLAGRQRMLSQNICKNLLLLSYSINSKDLSVQKAELEKSIHSWHLYHTGLQSGNLDTLDNKVNNSENILLLFKEIEPHFLTMYQNALAISNTLEISTPAYRERMMEEVLRSEKLYLTGMDKIVYQYALEARERVDQLKIIEFLLLAITIIILIIEGLFIFRPAVSALNDAMEKLMESESKAVAMNKELINLNLSLRKTEQELLNSTNEKYKREMTEQKIRSTSLIKGQESERKRIARDIHDGVGQMLTALKLNLESINLETIAEREKTKIDESRKLVAKTISETRSITFNLMPTVLSDFGIVSGIKQLTEQASKNSNAHVTFICPNTFSRLEKSMEIGIYRICQEAINNAVKYAQATEITLELLLKDSYIYLNIADNGKGFNIKRPDLDSEHKKINNGIQNMQERTHLLDGEFKITSVIGKGTKILAKIPVKYL